MLNSTQTKLSTDDLKQVITSIDSFSQQGFSEIAAIARLAISASESTQQTPTVPSDIISILHLIQGISSDIQNSINYEAETVDCNFKSGDLSHA